MSNLWYIGAMLSIVGSIASNLGVNTQKYSFMKSASLPKEKQRPYTRQPLWLLGLSGVIVGSLGDFAALALAAQSIVAPIGSVTLVANLFFASIWLKEVLTKKDIFGTFLIISGCVVSVVFGNHDDKDYTVGELEQFYQQTAFIVYAVVAISLCLLLWAFLKHVEPIRFQLDESYKRYDEFVEAEDMENAAVQSQILTACEAKYTPFLQKMHPFAYCALSGTSGAQSILFGKMVAVLIKNSISGDNQMTNFLTYVFLGSMLVCIFIQLHFLALGLALFDALYVVPVFQCFFITGSTLGGLIYFQEFNTFTSQQYILFPLGILITILGVYLLSTRKMNKCSAVRFPSQEELAEAVAETEVGKVVATDGEAVAADVEDIPPPPEDDADAEAPSGNDHIPAMIVAGGRRSVTMVVMPKDPDKEKDKDKDDEEMKAAQDITTVITPAPIAVPAILPIPKPANDSGDEELAENPLHLINARGLVHLPLQRVSSASPGSSAMCASAEPSKIKDLEADVEADGEVEMAPEEDATRIDIFIQSDGNKSGKLQSKQSFPESNDEKKPSLPKSSKISNTEMAATASSKVQQQLQPQPPPKLPLSRLQNRTLPQLVGRPTHPLPALPVSSIPVPAASQEPSATMPTATSHAIHPGAASPDVSARSPSRSIAMYPASKAASPAASRVATPDSTTLHRSIRGPPHPPTAVPSADRSQPAAAHPATLSRQHSRSRRSTRIFEEDMVDLTTVPFAGAFQMLAALPMSRVSLMSKRKSYNSPRDSVLHSLQASRRGTLENALPIVPPPAHGDTQTAYASPRTKPHAITMTPGASLKVPHHAPQRLQAQGPSSRATGALVKESGVHHAIHIATIATTTSPANVSILVPAPATATTITSAATATPAGKSLKNVHLPPKAVHTQPHPQAKAQPQAQTQHQLVPVQSHPQVEAARKTGSPRHAPPPRPAPVSRFTLDSAENSAAAADPNRSQSSSPRPE